MFTTKRRWIIFLVAGVILLAGSISPRANGTAQAGNPALNQAAGGVTIPYTGRLTNEAGQPVTGDYTFTFTLFLSETGEEALWSEVQTGVKVSDGVFSVILGSQNPLPPAMQDTDRVWLAASVRGPGENVFTDLSPRLSLNSESWAQPTDPILPSACAHNHLGETWSPAGLGLQIMDGAGDRGVLYLPTWAGTIGVYGQGEVGVSGYSTNGSGVMATGAEPSTSTSGDLILGGDIGQIVAAGESMMLSSGGSADFFIDSDGDSDSLFRIWGYNPILGWLPVMTVSENGNLWAAGTKSAMVQTASHGARLLYATESAQVWFEDIGSATLENGQASVRFEPIFAETVNLQGDYHVFLTPVCQEPAVLFVSSKSQEGFTVQGVTISGQPSSCKFDYRIVAPRLGYEDVRLEPAAVPSADQ